MIGATSLENVGAAVVAAACSALTELPDHTTAAARIANVATTYLFIMISLDDEYGLAVPRR
jgi:hypothetical protein